MRGSGYAIGEILIFLAIAAIIGFLIGWVVFYRRPGKDGSDLSEVNPNHVRQLESRTRAVESTLGRLEKRATALVGTLQKARPQAGEPEVTEEQAPAVDARIAPAAAAPEGAGKHGPRAADAGQEAPEAPPPGETEDEKEAAEAPAGAEARSGEKVAAADYLTEADDRLAKLEDTLDKLNEKLAELDES